MKAVRCPKCGRLLGYFDGKGEMVCPRCRKGFKVFFDTALHKIEIKRIIESDMSAMNP